MTVHSPRGTLVRLSRLSVQKMFSLLALPLLLQATLTYGEWISVPNGATWGDWGPVQECPGGTVVKAFNLKVENGQGPGDDTSVNAIRLYCAKKTETNIKATISSTEAPWGDWTAVLWCPRGYPINFALQVEKPQGKGDDTAVNNMKMTCSDTNVIEGSSNPWGDYGAWSGKCPHGICGIQTKVEEPQGDGDDTALNDVKMKCCSA